MGRIGWMLAGGAIALAVQATGAADERRIVDFYSSSGDCSKGTVEVRLDCLNRSVEQIKQLLDGRSGRVLPLGR